MLLVRKELGFITVAGCFIVTDAIMSDDHKTWGGISDLEKLLTTLAKECLTKQPKDVETFCLEFLAGMQGMQLSPIVKLMRGVSMAVHEDLREFIADVDAADLVSDTPKKSTEPCGRAYHSSEDSEEEVRSVKSYHSNTSAFDVADEFTSNGMEYASKVRIAAPREGGHISDISQGSPVCYLFSTDVITEEELEFKTKRYQNDERMKSLFRAWDGDDSGAVDFVELVLALHKFEQVGAAGIDIQVASDALLEFVESDTDRELKFSEFTRVIILFALNNFNKDFDEVADHMLAVATSTSEAAVISARSGEDTSAIEAADKAEEEFLRETVKGMEQHVTENIRKIRTKRVAFRQSNSRMP